MNAPAIRDDALDRIRAAMEDAGAGALVVTDPPSVRYLSGFTTPADGIVVVREEDAFLVTDTRYTAQADAESRIDVRFARPWHQEVAQLVEDRATAVEADAMTLSDANILAAALGRPLIETQGIVRGIRAVKSSAELEALREAARITDLAFNESLRWIRPGVREVDVAWRIEGFLRQHGATAGFEIVVASGVRSAMPHGVASDKLMEEGELVTLDFGARVRGYHADLTRTVAIGSPTDAAASLHEAVAEAQALALEAIRPGAHGRELDDLARRALEARGLAEAFAHSLGHGVGLQIHESPTLSRRSDDRLSAGMVVTVEPGAYFPGIHGVRIEDLVVVTDHGREVLSRSDKGLIRIEPQAA